VSALFDPEPKTWGLRGDPYLWRALREPLADTNIPATDGELVSLLRTAFREVTGIDLATEDVSSVYLEEYAHGGMSSGRIHLGTWRDKLIPLLAKRAGKPSAQAPRRTTC
jgi:hypothetical protein